MVSNYTHMYSKAVHGHTMWRPEVGLVWATSLLVRTWTQASFSCMSLNPTSSWRAMNIYNSVLCRCHWQLWHAFLLYRGATSECGRPFHNRAACVQRSDSATRSQELHYHFSLHCRLHSGRFFFTGRCNVAIIYLSQVDTKDEGFIYVLNTEACVIPSNCPESSRTVDR